MNTAEGGIVRLSNTNIALVAAQVVAICSGHCAVSLHWKSAGGLFFKQEHNQFS